MSSLSQSCPDDRSARRRGHPDAVSRALRLAERCPQAAMSDPDVIALVRALRAPAQASVQRRVKGLNRRPLSEEEPHDPHCQ